MRATILALSLCLAGAAQAAPQITPVASGFDGPWAVGFLPDGGILVTEKAGALILLDNGEATRIGGLPDVREIGQGGLLDVMVPRDFAQSREVFLSYAKNLSSGQGTALARGILAEGSDELTELTDVFVMTAGSSGGTHFGSRIVEGTDGTLFMTIGERGDADLAPGPEPPQRQCHPHQPRWLGSSGQPLCRAIGCSAGNLQLRAPQSAGRCIRCPREPLG